METPFPGPVSVSSCLLFSWFGNIIRLGERKVLQEDDLLALPDNCSARYVYTEFLKRLCSTMEAPEKGRGGERREVIGDNLWTACHQLIFGNFWLAGACRLGNDVLVLLGPVWVRALVQAAQREDTADMAKYAVLLFGTFLTQALLLQQFINLCFHCGQKVVTAVTCAVFHSSLVRPTPPLSSSPKNKSSVATAGEIYNMQSKDAASLREFVVFAHNLWACPLLALGAVVLLATILGWASLVSVVLLCSLVPVETALSHRARVYRKQVLKVSDERVALVQEVVDGITTAKLTNLCGILYARVAAIRDRELKGAWQGMRLNIVNSFLVQSANILVSVCSFGAYVLIYSSESLTADKIFAAAAIINILGRPITVIPKCMSLLSEVNVSLARLAGVIRTHGSLDSPQVITPSPQPPRVHLHDLSVVYTSSPAETAATKSAGALAITGASADAQAVTFSGTGQTGALQHVNLTLQGPCLVGLCGANSSGKSTLLSAILGDVEPTSSASCAVEVAASGLGAVAYCSDDPWVMSGTVLYNILLGRRQQQLLREDASPHEAVRVEELSQAQRQEVSAVCARCCLEEDLAAWPGGLDTVLGEKGINVSGGQRARVALARALYSQARVLLLDSTLSGLDAAVSVEVFTSAVQRAAESALVVLVTHDEELVQACDREVRLQAGRVVLDAPPQGTSQWRRNAQAPGGSVSRRVQSTYSVEGSTEVVAKKTSDIGSSGAQLWSIYAGYFRACGAAACVGAVILSVLTYMLAGIADTFLSKWADSREQHTQEEEELLKDSGSTNSSLLSSASLLWYPIIAGAVAALNMTRYTMYASLGLRASRALHSRLTSAILHAKFSFFDTTPSGRIYSRFSSDFDTIDFKIPGGLVSSMEAMLGVTTSLLLICYLVPMLVLPLAPIVYLYFTTQDQYRHSSRELMRIMSGTKSPILSHFREVLSGLSCIRGYGIEDAMLQRHFELSDRSARARLNWDAANRWLGIRIDIIGVSIISATSFFIAFGGVPVTGGLVGLLLTYSLKATNSLSFAIRSSTALENMFASPERVLEYCELGAEDSSDSFEEEVPQGIVGNVLSLCWQSVTVVAGRSPYSRLSGEDDSEHDDAISKRSGDDVEMRAGSEQAVLQLVGLRASYSKDSPDIVCGVDLALRPGRLVGVCGRTGSGKSTLAMTIARAVDGSRHSLADTLFLNGESALAMPLSKYRARVQLFPQHYYLLSGTVREVVDPAHEHSDTTLREKLQLMSAVVLEHSSPASSSADLVNSDIAAASAADMPLHKHVEAGGANLSAGQRQVLAFVRVALSSARVVVLDEFNSSMDGGTSRRAFQILRSELLARGVAVLMICHRLEDAFSCDELVVMERGLVRERGAPAELATRSGSLFAALSAARAANDVGADEEVEMCGYEVAKISTII